MIQFLTGKPGDGKSLFATRQILEDLINTDRFIVTNIPLVPEKVQEYVSARREGFNFDDRVKVIPDAEVYEFYRHRSGGLVLPWSPDRDAGQDGTKRLTRPDFTDVMKKNFMRISEVPAAQIPVSYYIDETHNFFSARDWATNGRGTLYYASQHRHLHDEIILITQVMENVEKQLRGLASETHIIRNQLRRRVGPFRLRPIFRVKSYYGVPQGFNATAYAESSFELDPAKVASCYKTTGALGVFQKPEDKKNKGRFPWWMAIVFAAVGIAALMSVVFVIPGWIARRATDKFKPAHDAVSKGAPGSAPAAAEKEKIDPDLPPAKTPPVVWTGRMQRGKQLWYFLSDGRVLRQDQILQRGFTHIQFRDLSGKIWVIGPKTPGFERGHRQDRFENTPIQPQSPTAAVQPISPTT